MKAEENWLRSKSSSTQLRMTNFKAQLEAARLTKWNNYVDWTSNESLIHDHEFVSETPVTCTNIERPKRP